MHTLTDLIAALPGLARVSSERPKRLDWDRLSRLMGTDLPQDFMGLAEAFPSMEIGGFLRIWIPSEGGESEYAEAVQTELETLQYLAEDGESGGRVPYPAKGGLLPWGASLEGDVFYWRTNDPSPLSWSVTVGGANGSWWDVDCGLIEFVVGLINGTCDSGELPPEAVTAESSVVALA
ncbi:SMI1/KNR4 family protein [Streptomyces sp. NPDC051219]|uniref:SMI1/KNR4 family protein n=1 Tax=Streptomyces sp. NPDC051219 TaxID=3155283 RepID=UPI003435821A